MNVAFPITIDEEYSDAEILRFFAKPIDFDEPTYYEKDEQE